MDSKKVVAIFTGLEQVKIGVKVMQVARKKKKGEVINQKTDKHSDPLTGYSWKGGRV